MMPGLIQKQQMWKIYVHIMQLFTNVRHKKDRFSPRLGTAKLS